MSITHRGAVSDNGKFGHVEPIPNLIVYTHGSGEFLKWAATWQNQQNECAPSEDSDQPRHPPSLISLGIRPVWSESSLSAWRKLGSLATQKAHIKASVQTGRMPKLIWVFAGRTLTLLVLSCRGSNYRGPELRCLIKFKVDLKLRTKS